MIFLEFWKSFVRASDSPPYAFVVWVGPNVDFEMIKNI